MCTRTNQRVWQIREDEKIGGEVVCKASTQEDDMDGS
jgi:hypothetical protein